ncbi:MAG TPA: hypothetical protein VGI66_01830 [Streptosporangiaceae bacterium]
MSDAMGAKAPTRERREPADWHLDSELTPLEEEMVACAAAGELVDGGGGPFNLAQMQAWGQERTVRAAVLRHLLIGKDWPTDARGVRLRGIRISGPLDLEAAVLHCSLHLDSCFLDAELVCLDQATATGLTITGCHLAGLTGELLTAKTLDLSGSTLTGPLRLPGASMTGALSCRGAHLTGCDSDGNALVAEGIRVGGEGVLLDSGFIAAGAIRLPRADITGALSCGGARLTGCDKDRKALVADGIKVGFDVFLDDGFAAAGAISLLLADITGMLSCRDADLAGRDNDGLSLAGYGMRVTGDVWLDGRFTATGGISLGAARAGRTVWLHGKLAADESNLALDAAGAQIAGTFRWAPAEQVNGRVNLDGAAVGELDDDWTSANGFWPADGRLSVKGFTYDRIGGTHPATVDQRLNWIRSQYPAAKDALTVFATQPYEQLAAVCRRAGQDGAARKVAIARRADLRKYGNLNPYRKVGNWLLDRTIKYGYQTWRAAVGLVVVFGIFLALSVLGQHQHVIVPVGDIRGLHPVPSATQCTSTYPCFYPAGYTIDTVIPLINVHQAEYWGPDGHAPWGWLWVGGAWVATGLGWALATLLVAGYTGLVRRE